ncbi:polyprotein [Cucumis melo var. makuwa]|uniref:Polyprotein n=1 Tax=Cucumis melo var. makuwa TaxID=1194695 RepID=A0A5D3BIR4_CUCMM|nr:polyprotein [Cucumis melo var. makuwa]
MSVKMKSTSEKDIPTYQTTSGRTSGEMHRERLSQRRVSTASGKALPTPSYASVIAASGMRPSAWVPNQGLLSSLVIYLTPDRISHPQRVADYPLGKPQKLVDNHLTDANREAIKDAVLEKTEQGPNGDVVTIQSNSVNTLIYAAIKHFVGRTTLYSGQSMEALLGMKCPKMSNFKWCVWRSINNRSTLQRLQRTQIIGENWDLSVSNMELTTLLLLGKRFDPGKSLEGVKRVNWYSNCKRRYHGKTKELSSKEEEFSSEKEEDLLNVLLEESSEEPSSSKNEKDNEEVIPCSGCINVLTSTQKGLLDIIEEVNDDVIRKKILLRLREDLETPDQSSKIR